MKKIIVLLLVAALLLGLPGCGGGEKEKETDKFDQYNDSLIEEQYSMDGSYTFQDGMEWDYSFHVPQLISDSADGEAINAEIRELYGQATEESLSSMKKGEVMALTDISWESHWQGSVLYLIVKAGQLLDAIDYHVFAFDFASGNRLNNADILNAAGVTEEDFLRETRRSAVVCFDEMNKELSVEDWYDYGCMEMRAYTMSNEALNENTMMFIDDDGKLTVICQVGSVAGDSWYYHVLKPEFQHDNKTDKETLRFVTAELKDGEVTVSFEKDAESDDYLSPMGLEYGKKYVVHGLSTAYSDIFLGIYGQSYYPYIFMVSEEGRVEYVNIFEGLSGGYMCASGSLPGINDIVSIKEGKVKDTDGSFYTSYFAVNKAGEEIDLFEPVTDMERWVSGWYMKGNWTSGKVTHDVDGGGSYESEYFLDIAEDTSLFLTDSIADVDIMTNYEGYLRYMGMNEEGMIYYYWLNSEYSEKPDEGVLAIRPISYDMSIKILGGDEIFDAKSGEYTKFVLSAW